MAADLGLVSPSKLQKLSHHRQTLNNPSSTTTTTTTSSWMWSPKQPTGEDDDSWEVRAFAEDTNQAMGTTWPPRSYTCTFCRREFRSAQALGGHMNVHRRDRARLHQAPAGPISPTSPSAASLPSSSSTLIIPTQELVASGTGLCFLYSLPNPKDILSPATTMNTSTDTSSNLLSISPYPPPPINFPVASPTTNSSLCHSTKTEPPGSIENDSNQNNNGSIIAGELDLELRLGRSSSRS